MPSPISINVKCEIFLIRFMEGLYGEQPIVFPKKDTFAGMLNEYLDKAPDNYVSINHGENNLAILLSYFEDKNVLHNFYLSPVAEEIFVKRMDDLFRVMFRSDVNKGLRLGLNRIDVIHLFMDRYNIPEYCIDMLLKDYQRYRKDCRQQRYRSKKITSD